MDHPSVSVPSICPIWCNPRLSHSSAIKSKTPSHSQHHSRAAACTAIHIRCIVYRLKVSTKFCLLKTFSHWKSEEVTSSSCTFFSVKAKGRRQFMPSLNIADCFPRNFVCTFSSETGQLCPRSASLYWAALGWAGLVVTK